ncbi:MAG: segregation/condensation protein A [Candidatus Fermentibacteraceae bacterium]|nr:segregation/condensation protein A [Candidatus Fermentibacteraceae bacterium]
MSADTQTACRINIQDFEGPLDLLLFLIRRDELDVTTIHMAEVADQYLDYIREAEELNLDIAGEYLVMAATLTRMKSRLLLPVERAIMEDYEDPMDSLMRHLVLYRAFKEVASELRESESIWRDVFTPPGERERYQESITEVDQEQTSLLDLLLALENMSEKNAPPPEHRIRKPLLSLSECVAVLDRVLSTEKRRKFTDAVGENADQAVVVSFFVTILELVKRGWLTAEQRYPFAEITIQRKEERWE